MIRLLFTILKNIQKNVLGSLKPNNIQGYIFFTCVMVFIAFIMAVDRKHKEIITEIPINPSELESLKGRPLEKIYSDIVEIDDQERRILNSLNTSGSPIVVPKAFLPVPSKEEDILICRTFDGINCLPFKRNGKIKNYHQLVMDHGYKFINNRVLLLDSNHANTNIIALYLALYVSKTRPVKPDPTRTISETIVVDKPVVAEKVDEKDKSLEFLEDNLELLKKIN